MCSEDEDVECDSESDAGLSESNDMDATYSDASDDEYRAPYYVRKKYHFSAKPARRNSSRRSGNAKEDNAESPPSRSRQTARRMTAQLANGTLGTTRAPVREKLKRKMIESEDELESSDDQREAKKVRCNASRAPAKTIESPRSPLISAGDYDGMLSSPSVASRVRQKAGAKSRLQSREGRTGSDSYAKAPHVSKGRASSTTTAREHSETADSPIENRSPRAVLQSRQFTEWRQPQNDTESQETLFAADTAASRDRAPSESEVGVLVTPTKTPASRNNAPDSRSRQVAKKEQKNGSFVNPIVIFSDTEDEDEEEDNASAEGALETVASKKSPAPDYEEPADQISGNIDDSMPFYPLRQEQKVATASQGLTAIERADLAKRLSELDAAMPQRARADTGSSAQTRVDKGETPATSTHSEEDTMSSSGQDDEEALQETAKTGESATSSSTAAGGKERLDVLTWTSGTENQAACAACRVLRQPCVVNIKTRASIDKQAFTFCNRHGKPNRVVGFVKCEHCRTTRIAGCAPHFDDKTLAYLEDAGYEV